MSKTRFVVEVRGTPRKLFSVREIPNSDDPSKTDLNIHFGRGGRSLVGRDFEDLVPESPDENYLGADIHVSVHATTRSQNNTLIKRTIEFHDRDAVDSALVTSAIKRDRLFVPILFRICGDLSRRRYDVPSDPDPDIISLGEIDPTRDQLRFMVVIGPSGKPFRWHDEHPSNLVQRPFRDYDVVVIHSRFNRPALRHSISLSPFSVRDIGPIPGIEWWEVYNVYTEWNARYAELYFDRVDKTP